MTALSAQLDIPLQFSDVDMALCAADAFATEHTGGLGGWWAAPGAHPEKNVQCTGSVFQSPRNLFHLGSQSHLKAFNLASPRWRRWRN